MVHLKHISKLKRAHRPLQKVMNFKLFKYPTSNQYDECDVLTARKLVFLDLILTLYLKILIDPALIRDRRQDMVCPTKKIKTLYVNKCPCYLGPMLYNQFNKI